MPHSARHLVLAWLSAAFLLLASAARAEDDATTTAAARERFKEGVSYFDQKQYEKARAAFVQAYALKKHPAVLLNLAQSELRSGHERDAAKHFAAYLREATEASTAEREAAQAGLASAKAVVAEIALAADAGAELLVNGALEGLAPLEGPIYLDPGSHTFEARKGEQRAKQSVSLKAGESRELRLSLSAPSAPKAASPKAGPLRAASNAAEPAESEGEGTAGGKRESFTHWVTTNPAGVIPAGAAVVFGLGAGGFAIASSLAYGDADDMALEIEDNAREDKAPTGGICTDPKTVLERTGYPPGLLAGRAAQYAAACSSYEDDLARGDTFKTVAIVSGIGAGALAVTTVVLYFATASEASPSAAGGAPGVALSPWFSPGEGGLSLTGRF